MPTAKFAGKWSVDKSIRTLPVASPVVGSSSTWRQPEVRPVKGKFIPGCGAKAPTDRYTGDKVVGIAVMHKSCLQPVFSQTEAEESAKMRRG